MSDKRVNGLARNGQQAKTKLARRLERKTVELRQMIGASMPSRLIASRERSSFDLPLWKSLTEVRGGPS